MSSADSEWYVTVGYLCAATVRLSYGTYKWYVTHVAHGHIGGVATLVLVSYADS